MLNGIKDLFLYQPCAWVLPEPTYKLGESWVLDGVDYEIINKSGTAVYALRVGTPRNNINESDVIRIKLPGVI